MVIFGIILYYYIDSLRHPPFHYGFNSLIAFLLGACFPALAPSNAQAAGCLQWDASGRWTIQLASGGGPVNFVLQQSGSKISGTASFEVQHSAGFVPPVTGPPFAGEVTGTVQGSTVGNEIALNVHWQRQTADRRVGRLWSGGQMCHSKRPNHQVARLSVRKANPWPQSQKTMLTSGMAA
jgi:hypothetical protein